MFWLCDMYIYIYVQNTGFDSFPFFSPLVTSKSSVACHDWHDRLEVLLHVGTPSSGPSGFPVAKWDDPAAEATRPMATHNRITRFDWKYGDPKLDHWFSMFPVLKEPCCEKDHVFFGGSRPTPSSMATSTKFRLLGIAVLNSSITVYCVTY